MTTTFAAPAGYATTDPTDVMGKRFVAWLVDTLLFLAVVGGILAVLGEYKDVDESYDDHTEFCEDLLDANDDFDGNCIAPPFGDRVYLVEYSDTAIYSSVGFVFFLLNFVIIQGATGASIGKFVGGVRVVDETGATAGMGRCLGRTLLLFVDNLPGIPLVGAITAWTSNGHRRVGDMVAGTYVIDATAAGRPVSTPAVAAPAGVQAWGAAPPQPPAAWPQQPQPTWEQPAPQPPAGISGWAAPAAETDPTQAMPLAAEPTQPQPVAPTVEPAPAEPLGMGSEPEPDGELAPSEPDEAADPTGAMESATSDDDTDSFDPSATVAGAHAPWTSTAPPPEEPAPAAAPAAEPQWDEARGTYIQWDATANVWLQWDAAANAWVPIS